MENKDLIIKHEREIGELTSMIKSLVISQEKTSKNLEKLVETTNKLNILISNHQEEISKFLDVSQDLLNVQKKVDELSLEANHKEEKINQVLERLTELEEKLDPLEPLGRAINTISNKVYYVVVMALIFVAMGFLNLSDLIRNIKHFFIRF